MKGVTYNDQKDQGFKKLAERETKVKAQIAQKDTTAACSESKD